MTNNNYVSSTRILIAVENANLRSRLGKCLHDHGFQAETVTSDTETTDKIYQAGQGYYAVLLLDQSFNDCLEVLTEIQKFQPELPMILFIGKEPQMDVETLEKGVYSYLTEPFTDGELVASINALIQQDFTLRQVAATVCEVLDTQLCLVWVLNKTRDQFEIKAWNGLLDEKYRLDVMLDYHDLDTLRFIQAGCPISCIDVTDPGKAKHYKHKDNARQRRWHSLLSSPMIYQGRVIGLLDAYSVGKIQEFEEKDKRVIHSLASQATATMYNNHLYRQSQALTEINQLLSGTYDLDAVLNEILEKVLRLAGTDIGWLYILDRKDNDLMIRACQGIDKVSVRQNRKLGEGVTGWVALHGKAQQVPDVTNDERYLSDSVPNIHSELSVPLKREDVVHGVLTAKSTHPNAFTEDDMAVLLTFAEQAAVAVERDKLAHYMREISQLALSKDLDSLLEYVVNAIHDLTGLTVSLRLLHEKDKTLRILAHRGLREAYARESAIPLESSVTGAALQKKELLWRRDIQHDTGKPIFLNSAEARRQGWHFFVTVPLLGREKQPLGALNLHGPHPRDCSEARQTLLWTFANQVAIAIEAHFRRIQLERLTQISDILSHKTILGLKPVLEQTAQSACELFGADYVAIYPYDYDNRLFYDQENIVIYGVSKPLVPKEKPRQKGLAVIIRNIDELVVHDIDTGEMNDVDFSKILEQDVTKVRLLEFIRKEKFVQAEGVKAFAGISMKTGLSEPDKKQKEVGIIYINYCMPHQFSEEKLHLIRLFGQQVGSAIHNVRYLEKEQQRYKQRVQDISALKEINSAILHKNLKNVTQLILEKIIELTGGSYSTLRLLDESGEFLRLEALEGRDTIKETLPVDGCSISGWIAMTGESVICPDVRDCPHYTQWYPDVKSCMATPLKSSDQVIGTLYVESTDLGAFSEQYQLDLLQALADQASIVIENMQLYEQRAKDMDALREINEIVVSGELDKILKIIIQKAVQTMPGEYSSLWLIDPGTGDLILQAVRGPGEEITRKVRRIQTGAASINVLVAKEGKPYICGDAEADPYFYKIYDKAKSSITVPLKYRDRTIGTLNVESSKLEAFNDQHRQLLVSFSDQAAIAIENAKLYKNLQMQGEAQIEAIGKISSSIAASLNLEDVLDSILDWTIKLMGEASLGEIRLLDSKTNELVVAQYRGEDTIDKYMSVPVGKGITGWVAQHRTPLMVPDVSEDSRYLPFLDGTKSEIAVPMLKEDELIGVLNVEHHRINAFTDYDFKIAGAIANLAAIAIGNARMYEQLQKQREEQIKAIGEISESIAAPQELNRILGGILDWTISLMGEACLAEVKLFESRTNELVTKCVRGISKQEFRRIPVGVGITGWVAQNMKPVIAPDVSKDNRYSCLLEDTNSEIAVPILKKEELIGVLNIEHPNTNAFTEDDLGLAVAIANITAIAIDNAQIYNQLARKIANLGAVNKVGQMLTSGIDLTEQQILMSIYNHTKELMDVENMYIALYEPDQDEPDKYYPDEPGESIIHGTVRFGLVIDNDRLLDIVNETEWWKRKATARQGLTEYVIRTRRPYRPANVKKAYNIYAQKHTDKIPKSWLGVPMMIENKILGVVVLRNNDYENEYSQDDEDVLQAIANQTGIALKNARLVQQLDQRVRELKILHKLAEELSEESSTASI